jgi:hypothetical protein
VSIAAGLLQRYWRRSCAHKHSCKISIKIVILVTGLNHFGAAFKRFRRALRYMFNIVTYMFNFLPILHSCLFFKFFACFAAGSYALLNVEDLRDSMLD